MTDDDLRQRLEKLDQDLRSFKNENDKRLFAVEQRLLSAEKEEAIAAVHRDELRDRLARLDESFNKLNNNIGWLLKLIIGSLILAGINFAIGGGLAP